MIRSGYRRGPYIAGASAEQVEYATARRAWLTSLQSDGVRETLQKIPARKVRADLVSPQRFPYRGPIGVADAVVGSSLEGGLPRLPGRLPPGVIAP